MTGFLLIFWPSSFSHNHYKRPSEKCRTESFVMNHISDHNCPLSCFRGLYFYLFYFCTGENAFFSCSTPSGHWKKLLRLHTVSPVSNYSILLCISWVFFFHTFFLPPSSDFCSEPLHLTSPPLTPPPLCPMREGRGGVETLIHCTITVIEWKFFPSHALNL